MISLPHRALSGGAVAVLAAAALAACTGEEDPAESGPMDEVTYLTAFGSFGREAYVHVADAKGFFAEQNIEVSIEPGDPGNAELVTAGQADFAATDSSGALQRYEAGLDGFQIVSAVQQLPLMALITVEGRGITEPADLAGKTIGCAENSIIGLLFPAYAQANGFDPDSVTIEPVDAAQIPTALASEQVDAVCLFNVGQPAIEAAAGEPAVVLPYDEVMPDLYGAVHITSAELAEQDPDLVRRFNTAILKGLEYATAHPDEAGEILTEYVPETDPQVAAGELQIMANYVRNGLADEEPTGMMAASKATGAATLLAEAGLLEDSSGALVNEVMAWDLVPGAEEFDLEQR